MFAKASKTPAAPERAVPSILSPDLRIEGNLRCLGDLQIDGEVCGDIHSRSLTLGEGATVKGAIEAEHARICGTVEGQVRATTVVLTRTARVSGDILHEDLTIESGAYVDGHCRRLERAQGKPAPAGGPERDKPAAAAPLVAARGTPEREGTAGAPPASLAGDPPRRAAQS